jgi:hypothetical protein
MGIANTALYPINYIYSKTNKLEDKNLLGIY